MFRVLGFGVFAVWGFGELGFRVLGLYWDNENKMAITIVQRAT